MKKLFLHYIDEFSGFYANANASRLDTDPRFVYKI